MVNYNDNSLDRVFAALADPTRRRILASLAGGGLPVSQLARPHAMSLPGFMKHLRVLEEAELIQRSKQGRVVRCTLSADPMRGAVDWLARYETFWDRQLDALGRYLEQKGEATSWQAPQASRNPRSASSASTVLRRKRSGGRGPTRRR